jgi:hypothetical protein
MLLKAHAPGIRHTDSCGVYRGLPAFALSITVAGCWYTITVKRMRARPYPYPLIGGDESLNETN